MIIYLIIVLILLMNQIQFMQNLIFIRDIQIKKNNSNNVVRIMIIYPILLLMEYHQKNFRKEK